MNEQDVSNVLSAKLEEAEKASESRWFPRRMLLGTLASYAVLRGMRLAGRM